MVALISVIVPVYNVERYLNECFESLIKQTLMEIEIIVINDGSTDQSLNIIKEYMKQDDRIVLIDKQNEGVGVARNIGINMAKGKYVFFMDSDDYLNLSTFDVLYNEIEREKCDILIYNGKSFDDFDTSIYFNDKAYFNLNKNDENIMTGLEYIKRTGGAIVQPSMKLYNREFLHAHKIFFLESMALEDDYFFYKCMIQAKRVKYVDFIGYFRRYRVNSIMTSKSTYYLEARLKAFPELIKLADLVNNDGHNQEIRKQFAYFASLFWVLICTRENKFDMRKLMNIYRRQRLHTFVKNNMHDWKLHILGRIISFPIQFEMLNMLIAKMVRETYRSQSRYFYVGGKGCKQKV